MISTGTNRHKGTYLKNVLHTAMMLRNGLAGYTRMDGTGLNRTERDRTAADGMGAGPGRELRGWDGTRHNRMRLGCAGCLGVFWIECQVLMVRIRKNGCLLAGYAN